MKQRKQSGQGRYVVGKRTNALVGCVVVKVSFFFFFFKFFSSFFFFLLFFQTKRVTPSLMHYVSSCTSFLNTWSRSPPSLISSSLVATSDIVSRIASANFSKPSPDNALLEISVQLHEAPTIGSEIQPSEIRVVRDGSSPSSDHCLLLKFAFQTLEDRRVALQVHHVGLVQEDNRRLQRQHRTAMV